MSQRGPIVGYHLGHEVKRLVLSHVSSHGIVPSANQVRRMLAEEGVSVSRQAVQYHINWLRREEVIRPRGSAPVPLLTFLRNLGNALTDYGAGGDLEATASRYQIPAWLITVADRQSAKFCVQNSLDAQQQAG